MIHQTIIPVKMVTMMFAAAVFNLMAVVAEATTQPGTALQWVIAFGVFFSGICSVAAVLITHHVKVIVNSRMSRMIEMTDALATAKATLAEKEDAARKAIEAFRKG